ncbi:MAG: hypothetical protein KJN64_00500 [Ignavibacteria bacterium]|nr:hypothetical protein [Ignavibacteria bacterium]MBT8381119.1 hypothetical protein [Ignavibacteria bacterium]
MNQKSRKKMLEIIPKNIYWLEDANPEYDLCVHGGFTISFNKKTIIDASNENLTLSSAVIFLLRTIEEEHSFDNKICENLIPECGHEMFTSDSGGVEILTCPFGIDWWVEHNKEKVTLVFQDGKEITTTLEDYIHAVLKFAEKIKAFYDESESKKFYDEEEKKAFKAFNSEWNMRVERASKLI